MPFHWLRLPGLTVDWSTLLVGRDTCLSDIDLERVLQVINTDQQTMTPE